VPIFSVDKYGGVKAAVHLSIRDVHNHRRDALGLNSNDQPNLVGSGLEELIDDGWDEVSTHFCILAADGKQIVASLRVSRSLNSMLPFSELYAFSATPQDVEVGRTTVLPSYRGGDHAQNLLVAAMSFLCENRDWEYLFGDPVLGAKRGLTRERVEAMGFIAVSEQIIDRRYGLASQLFRMHTSETDRFWNWLQAAKGSTLR